MQKASNSRGPYYFDTSTADLLPICHSGKGKPSPRTEYLKQQRDEWIWLLEPRWADIGWRLESAETLDDIVEAFEPLSAHNPSLVAPFIRLTTEKATVGNIASTRKRQEDAVFALQSKESAIQTARRKLEDAERLAAVMTKEYRKQLEEDLRTRQKRIRLLKVRKSQVKGFLTRYRLLREKHGSRRPNRRDFTPYLEEKEREIDRDIRLDEKACAESWPKMESITPDNRKLADEEVQRRRIELDQGTTAVKATTAQYERLARRLADQEAHFFRADLLSFIKKRRYSIEPRQIAGALAGLPYMRSRRSAERCAKLKSSISPFLNYQVFLFVRSCWERRHKRGSLTLLKWFQNEVTRLPKHIGRGYEEQENPLRERLANDWYFLAKAVEETQALKSGRIPKDYFIAQRFLVESVNPSIPTDSIRRERFKLTS